MHTIDIITIFPDIFFGPFSDSIIARAIEKGLVKINTVDLRDYTDDKRRTIDDKPYGGGPGMLMKADPVFRAVEEIRRDDSYVILLTPQGKVFHQSIAEKFVDKKHLILICGHYEGIDERVRDQLVDMEISIGDYILTSGNIPAMAVVDTIVRLIPGVLGSAESSVSESFSDGILEYPQYTRPVEYRGMEVPEVLLSGNHQAIAEWRKKEALKRTGERRPELLR
jgi:tRNA (guanine37-N1)-methyltransferase